MTESRLPNFLYVGPDKSGSTWLFSILRQHEEVFIPAAKDIYFFDQQYERGLEWYLDFFSKVPATASAIGEISHSYLFSSVAADRIKKCLPDVRILSSLRNPVDRCFSHYLYLVSNGLTRQSFEDELKVRPGLTRSSFYADSVACYLERFGRARTRFLLFDDLEADAKHYAHEIFAFLDVSCVDGLDFETKVRPARQARSYKAARIVKWGAVQARHFGFPKLIGALKRSPLESLLFKPYQPVNRPSINPETRKRLVEYFSKDVERLAGLLDRDFSQWLV